VLGRRDVEIAVLETARGGILLRGVGYQSNDVSVLTNISSDHLDLQGIHTLAELTEVKSVIARITRPSGWVVLNADDDLVASVAKRVRANVAFFSTTDGDRGASPTLQAHIPTGGRASLVRRGRLVEVERGRATTIVEVAEVPITIGGIALHNVENALAAAGGARGAGASIDAVAQGLRDFRPSADRSPGRLNLFRVGSRIVIVDFAHNEAGLTAVLRVAEGIAAGGAGRASPITAIIGTAGDRPDDSLVGVGRIAGQHAQRVAIKESLHYLRGRTREDVVEQFRKGLAEAGYAIDTVPIYETETQALRTELTAARTDGARASAPRVIVLMCHEERDAVFKLIAELGGRPIDVTAELTELVPRLQERPRR
jgi:cyanophycin synthetase